MQLQWGPGRVPVAHQGVLPRGRFPSPGFGSKSLPAGVLGFTTFTALGRKKLCNRASEDELPSDEEMMRSFNARLPPTVRIYKERALNAEATLRKADQSIKALGIDLDKSDREQQELREILPPLSPAAVALCWPSEGQAALLASLRSDLDEVRLLDLEGMRSLEAEELRERLQGCRTVAVCCPVGEDLQLRACASLSTLLEAAPEGLQRIVLIADSAAPQILPMERHLKRGLRERSSNASPLRLNIVRANVSLGDESKSRPTQVLAKMPALVRDAAMGLKAMFGIRSAATLVAEAANFQSGQEDLPESTSPEALAKVLQFALRRGIDVPEVTVLGSGNVDFDEVLLPLVGPELWRLDVNNACRARAWVRGWVEFNYCRGANQNSSAMRRAGLKTPVEVRTSTLGACIKFLPTGSRTPGEGFEGLLEGGLEILVDEATDERSARIRVRRCAYGWRKRPRESSERAILSKLSRDWQLSEKMRAES